MKLKDIFKGKIKIRDIKNPRSRQKIKRESVIVHHYCPHTYNIGDHFVILSIRKYLKEYLPNALFIPKASAGNRGWGKPARLQGENINFSNEYADAVIVGGSDQYNNWDLRIKKDEINKLIPPLYMIGLGASSKKINEGPYIEHESLYEDIRITHEKARLSSVRDNFTKRFLDSSGYADSVVTGCPAMHLFNEEFHLNKDGKVALTFPFPVIRKRNRELYTNLTRKIERLLTRLKDMNLSPVIVCHDDRDVITAQTNFPSEKIFFSNYPEEFIDFYKEISFVVGSRLHASIFCSGLGKPFININIDFRGQAFSETFKLENWNLNIDDEEFEDKIVKRIETISDGDLSIFHDFTGLKSRYRNEYLDFMKRTATDIMETVGK